MFSGVTVLTFGKQPRKWSVELILEILEKVYIIFENHNQMLTSMFMFSFRY